MTQQPKKLLDKVRDAIRLKHYAYSTEKTYVYWTKRFVLYHNKRHPLEMGEKENDCPTYWRSTPDRTAPLWQWFASDGMHEAAGQGPGL